MGSEASLSYCFVLQVVECMPKCLKCPITERKFCDDIIYVQQNCFVWIGDKFYNLTTHQKWKDKTKQQNKNKKQ